MVNIFRNYWMLLMTVFCLCVAVYFLALETAEARNIIQYRDTLSDSGPSERSNHTINFTLMTTVSGGGYIEITPPSGFSILSTSTFAVRNIELYVNGVKRTSAGSVSLGVDGVNITTGSPGLIRYTLNPNGGLSAGDELLFRIGNHTSAAISYSVNYSTSTGTTTTPGDIEPIVNSASLGRHDVTIRVYDGSEVADADAIIFINEKVNVPSIDTRETVPPVRFNGRPTSSVGGTTLSVEISVETNEFAICRFSTAEGTSFGAMANVFSNEGGAGLVGYGVVHKAVVSITPDSVQRFYVRCVDDEGNINTDDYLITFQVTETPTGTANDEGDVSGDGSGSGNEGTGDGSGSGGTTGDSSGETPAQGGSAGTGGSGGGGGGNSGPDNEDDAGGGFELDDNPYESGDGEVVVNGYAFPGSTVVILVDGNAADTTTAGSDGRYSITLEEIARGVYTFGVYAVDDNDVRSSTFSTSFTVTGSRTTSLSNINVMPSISVSPDPVDIGQTLTISGYSIPNAEIDIENMKDKVSQSLREFQTTSNSDGAWSITVETNGFSDGTYKVRASANSTNVSTNFSNYTFYGVGQNAEVQLNADLNRDGSVNLIDFSILLFWWGGDGGDSDPPADINRDGNVSLTDFSILLFNWTG